MKICVICSYSLSMPGGVQNQSILLSRQFVADGHEVLLIAPGAMPEGIPHETYSPPEGHDKSKRTAVPDRKQGNFGSRLAARRFRKDSQGKRPAKSYSSAFPETARPRRPDTMVFHTVGKSSAVPANGSVAPVTLSPRAAYEMLKTVRGWSPDVVHIHEPFVPVLSLAASLRAKKANGVKPAIVAATFHRSGAGRAYKTAGLFFRGIYSKLNLCYAVSKPAQHTLAKVVGVKNSQRVSIVFNGVDLEYLSGINPHLGSNEDIFDLCFVGRLEPRKGLEVLLEALAGLEGKIRLSVLGAGAEMARLQSKYSFLANVFWLGRLPEDEMYARVKGTDLLVAPALGGESFGIVVLEAMALSVPVVCSNIPGHRASAGDAALFVPPNDPEALRTAVESLMKDPLLREELVAKGLLRARQFSVANLAKRYLADFAASVAAAGNNPDLAEHG